MLAVLDGVEDRRRPFARWSRWSGPAVRGDGRRPARGIHRDASPGKLWLRIRPHFRSGGQELGEIGPEAKDTMSHRALALAGLASLLQRPGSATTLSRVTDQPRVCALV